jgi:hypothetical protein
VPSDSERAAVVPTIFRAANETIAGRPREGASRTFICECGNETCLDPIELTVDEYESVRADGRRFAVAPGHEDADDAVRSRSASFTVVEKTGTWGELAAGRNPRAF